MIQITEAPSDELSIRGNYRIFLAGGISNSFDWQQEIIKKIKSNKNLNALTLFNPRRSNYDQLDPSEELNQISWEYNHLHFADAIIFWFTKETLNPITLYEFGKWGNSGNKPIIVGTDPAYKRKNDVIIQTKLARPEIEVVHSIDEIIQNLELLLKPKSNLDEA